MAQIEEVDSRDEVLEEVMKIKETLGAEMEFDVDRILEDARLKEERGGREIIQPPRENRT